MRGSVLAPSALLRPAVVAALLALSPTGAGGDWSVTQSGENQQARQCRRGAENTLAIRQEGRNQQAEQSTAGRGNTSTITQRGDGNRARIVQHGRHLDTTILQTGNGLQTDISATGDGWECRSVQSASPQPAQETTATGKEAIPMEASDRNPSEPTANTPFGRNTP